MHKVLKIWLIVFLLFNGKAHSQNKFALVVGINKYYDAPGVLNAHSLKGCVNDGKAVQRMLQNRYGFQSANIETLFDDQATKTNLLYKVRTILLKCKPGDVFVFYYSGHGVWMKNSANARDTLKHGLSQAIVLSDLYAEGRSFLFRDEQIKEILNKFIDRQVVTTSIFDCCYSENMAAMDYFTLFNGDPDEGIEKDFQEDYLPPLTLMIREPVPCANGADTMDTDQDGVPDCRDWEKYTAYRYPVDAKGINLGTREMNLYDMPDPAFDTFDLTGEKAFDISQTISINIRSVVPRPHEIKGSRFLGITATDASNKGLEIVDVAGERHGAFTAALMDVLSAEAKDLPAGLLMEKLQARMDQQKYWQGPRYRFEGDRKQMNLVGLKPAPGAVRLKASLVNFAQGMIALNKGSLDGVRVGNIFSLANKIPKQTVKIIRVTADSSFAILSNSSLKMGDVFEQTDAFSITSPKVRIYIPSTNMTPADFDKLMKTVVAPMSLHKNYVEHTNGTGPIPPITILRDIKDFQKTLPAGPEEGFTYLLPIPTVLANSYKAILLKNQNVELVSDPKNADMVPIMTFSDKEGFITSFNDPAILKPDYQGTYFQPIAIGASGRNLSKAVLDQLNKNFPLLVHDYLRKKTTAWLNYWPRR